MCFKVPLLNVHTNFVKVSEWRDIKNTFIRNKNVSTVFLELKMFHIIAVNNKKHYNTIKSLYNTPLCVCVCVWERKRAQSGSRHKWNRSDDCCSSLCLHWQLQFNHTYYLVQSVFSTVFQANLCPTLTHSVLRTRRNRCHTVQTEIPTHMQLFAFAWFGFVQWRTALEPQGAALLVGYLGITFASKITQADSTVRWMFSLYKSDNVYFLLSLWK